jgi:hypothetical protein
MSLRSELLKRGGPGFVKIRLLDELARVTAAGFGCAKPQWDSRALESRLDEYARFTADQARRILAANDPRLLEGVRHDLHRQSAELGAKVRRWLRVRQPADVLETLTALYGHLGMDMTAGDGEDIVVTRCLFASYFSEPVCRLVAALDEGMAAGLSAGGRLEFSERITGGAACCRARLDLARSAG